MSDAFLSNLRVLTDLLTVAACLSVLAALGWYALRMRGRSGGPIGTTALLGCFAMALAADRVARFTALHLAGGAIVVPLEIASTAVLVVVAVAVWPVLPHLFGQPTKGELVAANGRLVEEQEARQTLLESLQSLNEDLERRVVLRTREAEAERRRFEIALEGTAIAVAQQDTDLRYVWSWNLPPALRAVDPVGRRAAEWLPASTAESQDAIKRRVLASGVGERFEVQVPVADGILWFEGRVEPIMVDGRVDGVMTVSIDITRHKEHEREIRDMLRELTHRSKNLLAVVQGIARQSAVGSRDAGAFIEPFNARLQALSGVHELLVEEVWRGAALRDVIARESSRLGVSVDVGAPTGGPDLRLSPEWAQNFALAVHELLVDAAARPDGPIAVHWDVPAADRFVFEWRRSGAPSDRLGAGFGRVFLERVLPRAVSGEGRLRVAADETTYRLIASTAGLLRVDVTAAAPVAVPRA